MRVLVLGAGFGGLELTTRLSDELGGDVEVVLIDKAEGFAFGFSRLDVMFGRTAADPVIHPYRDLVKYAGADVMQQEVAEGMDDLVPEGRGHGAHVAAGLRGVAGGERHDPRPSGRRRD